MERIVNYSSEDENEDSPKRNAAERCPVLEIDPNKRNKGDSSSRHPKEESSRDRNQGSSLHRDRDHKESSHSHLRKSHKDESSRSSRPSSSRGDQYYNREDRRSERSHDKKRDSKDDRRRKDSHRERDRDYEHRDADRDRRDRSDKHRRDRYSKDSSHREKGKRRRSSDSPSSISKDHNTSSSSRNRQRSRSRSRSPFPKDQKPTASTTPLTLDGKPQKHELKDEQSVTSSSLSQNKNAFSAQAVLTPPLSDQAPKTSSIVINKTDGTPIALPTYYNPNVINPTKYAEQVQKRKLIWGAKKAEDTSAKWGHATFSEDSDGKVASKFMRLMGIKSAPKPSDSPADAPVSEKKGPDVKSRQAMFSNMEQQYEVARQVTHTMRGVGLGFGSQSRQY